MNHSDLFRAKKLGFFVVTASMLALSGCHNQLPAAKMGNQEFSTAEYLSYVEKVTPQTFQQDQTISGQSSPPPDSGAVGMIEMLRDAATDQLAAQKKCVPSKAEIDALYEIENKRNPGLSQAIQHGVLSEADLQRQIKTTLEQASIGSNEADISDADIQDYYNKNLAEFKLPIYYGVKMAIIPDQTTAVQFLNQVKASGDFLTAAMNNHVALQSGLLDGQEHLVSETQFKQVKPVYDVVSKLQQGQFVSAPIAVPNGKNKKIYVVAQLTREIPAETLTLQQVSPVIKLQLIASRFPAYSQHFFALLNDFIKSQKIRIYNPRYAQIVPIYLLAAASITSVAPSSGGAPGAPATPGTPAIAPPGAPGAPATPGAPGAPASPVSP